MKPVESWVIEPFERFHQHYHKQANLLHVLREALYFLQARPAMIEALREEWGPERAHHELKLALANSHSAKAELDAGHPTLHAQAVILLWGGLEALMSDFLA